MLSPMVDFEHLPLNLSGSASASQETAISGSCQHFLASTIVSGFGDYIWNQSPGGSVSGWPFLQPLHFVPTFPPMNILFSLLRRTEASTLWSSFFLSCVWSVNGILAMGLQPYSKNNIKQPDSPELPGTKPAPKSTHGGTHGFSSICSRGHPCWASMGGEALGPGKA